MPRKKGDAVTQAFEHYLVLNAEQRALFAAHVAGHNRALTGATVAVRTVRPATKGKPKANGPESQEGAVA